MHVKTLLIICIGFWLNPGYGYHKDANGYWFYNEEIEYDDEEYSQIINGNVVIRPSREVIKRQQQAIQDEFKYREALMYLYPSVENVAYYRELQQQSVNQASELANTWMYLTASNPELDASVKRPMSQLGAMVSDRERAKIESDLLKGLSETHGLYFVYAGSCSYCQKMASIVRTFADNHGLDLMGLSIDGVVLDEIPNNEDDIIKTQTKAIEWNIGTVPALVIYDDVQKKHLSPIHGLKTEDILKTMMLTIILRELGDD